MPGDQRCYVARMLRRGQRKSLTVLVTAVGVLAIGPALQASASTTTSRAALTTLGEWNGVVSFSTHQRETISGTETTAADVRAYALHGGTSANMTGSAHLRYDWSDYTCGAQSTSWQWSVAGASADADVEVSDGGVWLSFKNTVAHYTFAASGMVPGPPGDGTVPCTGTRVAQEDEDNGAGTASVGWTAAGHRTYLLRTSGSHTIKSGAENPNVSPGSLANSGASTVVTWNLLRTGLDRDHDGLADAGDPNPRKADTDGDGYSDGFEVDRGTNPRRARSHPRGPMWKGAPDNDGDGWSDATEITHGTDPTLASSHPSTHTDTGNRTPGTTKPARPSRPGGPWYSSSPVSVTCVTAGALDENTGSQLVQAKVRVTLGVRNSSQISGLGRYYASHMRTSARLELPVGTNMDRGWATQSYPAAGELSASASHAANFTVFTGVINRTATTDGGQPYRLHVKLIWDRKVPYADVVQDRLIPFNVNSGACALQ